MTRGGEHKPFEARDDSWMVDAACRGVDPELFFPERGAPIKQARKVCAGCPVREPCLEMAVDMNLKFGIFGGMSTKERKRVRRERGLIGGPPPVHSIADMNRERRERDELAEKRRQRAVEQSPTAPWEQEA